MVRACSNLWKFWLSPQLIVGNIIFIPDTRHSKCSSHSNLTLKNWFCQIIYSFLLRLSLLNQVCLLLLRLLQIFMFQACFAARWCFYLAFLRRWILGGGLSEAKEVYYLAEYPFFWSIFRRFYFPFLLLIGLAILLYLHLNLLSLLFLLLNESLALFFKNFVAHLSFCFECFVKLWNGFSDGLVALMDLGKLLSQLLVRWHFGKLLKFLFLSWLDGTLALEVRRWYLFGCYILVQIVCFAI